jgi:HSP20 family protein
MTITPESRPTGPPAPRRSPGGEAFPWNAGVTQLLDSLWRAVSPAVGFVPDAEIEETDDAFIVELDLPGVKKKDITIDVTGRRLSVRGRRVEKERRGLLRHSTRTVGEFSYELTLPVPVDEKGVKATYDDGVLRIELPKQTDSRTTRVAVE